MSSVYLETSMVSYLTARQSLSPLLAGSCILVRYPLVPQMTRSTLP